MARSKYATVKIPAALAIKLDVCCKDWGYRSRAEMVDEAVRLFITRMNQEGKSGGQQQRSAPIPSPTAQGA